MSNYLYEFGPGDLREFDPRTAQALSLVNSLDGWIFCGGCSGRGCELCEEPAARASPPLPYGGVCHKGNASAPPSLPRRPHELLSFE